MKENVSKCTLLYIVFVFLCTSCGNRIYFSGTNTGPVVKTETPERPSSATGVRKTVVDYAKKQSGVRYKYGGESRSGFDCSGLSCFVMKKAGTQLPHNSGMQSREGKKISVSRSKPGDLIFFGKGGKVNHVAIVISNSGGQLKVIHSTSSRGVIIEDVYASGYWKPRILFARDVLAE